MIQIAVPIKGKNSILLYNVSAEEQFFLRPLFSRAAELRDLVANPRIVGQRVANGERLLNTISLDFAVETLPPADARLLESWYRPVIVHRPFDLAVIQLNQFYRDVYLLRRTSLITTWYHDALVIGDGVIETVEIPRHLIMEGA